MSILANGGPITTAERIGNFCQLLGLEDDQRKVHIGFSAGRFEFMARPYGIVPRNSVESAAWSVLGAEFLESLLKFYYDFYVVIPFPQKILRQQY